MGDPEHRDTHGAAPEATESLPSGDAATAEVDDAAVASTASPAEADDAAVASTASPGNAVSGPRTSNAPLSAGTRIGEYVVERSLGAGGFGSVYEAVHPVIGKRVAIKVLAAKYSADAAAVSRFVSEARVANRVGHPSILGVFSFGRLADGRHYHVMDYVPGDTLETLIERKGALPLDEALPILRGIAAALDAAHAEGVIHRDLKPANVLLAQDGDWLSPRVIDFGVAKLLDDEERVHRTRSGALMGTPLYMSPEQCRGRAVDHRSDVYSFGVLAYELLTGKPPFEGEDAVDLLMHHTSTKPEPPSSVMPSLPEPVDAVLLAALDKDPTGRPDSLGDIVAQLEGCVDAPPRPAVTGNEAEAASGPDSGAGRRRLTAAVGIGALGAAALAVFLSTRSPKTDAPTPPAGASAVAPEPMVAPATEPIRPEAVPPTEPAVTPEPVRPTEADAGASETPTATPRPKAKPAVARPPIPKPKTAATKKPATPGPDDVERPVW